MPVCQSVYPTVLELTTFQLHGADEHDHGLLRAAAEVRRASLMSVQEAFNVRSVACVVSV